MKIFIVVLGADLINQGRLLGRETKARCEKSLEFFRKDQCFFVLSAGMGNYSCQKKSMAEMMADYLIEKGVPDNNILVGTPVWGTKQEIKEAEKIIALYQEQKRILVVSTWYHLPRIFLLCFKTNFRLSWNLIPTFKIKPKIKNLLLEIVKLAGEFLNVKRRLT